MTALEIKEFRKKYNLSQEDLAQIVGTGIRGVQGWEQGKRKISQSAILLMEQFVEKQLSAEQKEQFVTSNIQLIAPQNVDDDVLFNKFGNTFIPLENGGYLMETPLIPEYVRGGPMAGFADRQYFDELPKHQVVVEKIHRGKYISAIMRGESMFDENNIDGIKENAVLTGRECQKIHWKSKLSLGKDFIIAHKDGLIVKRIIDHSVENGIITCHSLNPDKDAYPDFELFLGDVDALFNVIKVENPR